MEAEEPLRLVTAYLPSPAHPRALTQTAPAMTTDLP